MNGKPQYLLFCDSQLSGIALDDNLPDCVIGEGRWQFVLERLDEPERFEAFDVERHVHRDRIALLAVVRGLEAVERSSFVKLLTTSRYVDRGVRFGLPNWRETNFLCESFGELKPIRNADLWERIDTAMRYHVLECRLFNSNHDLALSHLHSAHRNSQTPARNRRIVHPEPQPNLEAASSTTHVSQARRSLTANRSPARRQWWEMASAWINSSGEGFAKPMAVFNF